MKQNGCAEELDVAYFVSRGKTKTTDCKTENASIAYLIKTPNLRSITFNVVFNWCVFVLPIYLLVSYTKVGMGLHSSTIIHR
jgi:hypothetical protein